jgi:dTDP-4-amino-4,6-dideoxygalactose transaminase
MSTPRLKDTGPVALPSDQEASGRTLGDEEIALLSEAIRSGTLTSTKGRFVKELEKKFAAILGVDHVVACASGTAAVHTAIAALDLEPGDEVITTGITDMGALSPILYQGGIPVFADVDERSLNLTPETVAQRMSERTRAVVLTHLFGNPCDAEGIRKVAEGRNVAVIEDCAQAFLARNNGRLVGTIGEIGCFSLQQGKHITTGEGGLVATNDPALARQMFLFVNKAWGYGDERPDHYFLALNYRMSELQGAVAVAQLEKLEWSVTRRQEAAERLSNLLADLAGIATPGVLPKSSHSYWKYCLTVDAKKVRGGASGLGAFLKDRGIASAPRYIQKPAFQCQVFRAQKTFGKSRYPFTLARPEALDYHPDRFPGTFAGLESILVLPWSERYQNVHIDFIAESIRDGVENLAV